MKEQNLTAENCITAFEAHSADKIGTMLGVSGWVPAAEVDSLLEAVPHASVQYWTGDKVEAFVIADEEDRR